MKTYQILETGKSATDSDTLSARINSYSKFATAEINSVLETELSNFDTEKELKILDLGCGTGKQSEYLSEMFPNAKIFSVDISEDSINKLSAKKINNITPICASFDSPLISEILSSHVFDIVVV
jgi:trans-aconitate methyltransferase